MHGAPFSLVLDETNHLASTRHVSVCSRYCSPDSSDIVTAYMGTIKIEREEVGALSEAILR